MLEVSQLATIVGKPYVVITSETTILVKKDGDDMVFNLDRAIQSTRLETILR